jgi:hypothetical protein
MTTEFSEALQLAGVMAKLHGCWAFVPALEDSGAELREVDVPATNDRLVLGQGGLGKYTAIRPDDARLPRMADVMATAQPLAANRLALILLCGGLNTRSAGKVHPLAVVRDPLSGRTASLLSLQLQRIRHSPLADAKLLLFASPLNAPDIRTHLAEITMGLKPWVFSGGLVPRLARYQPSVGPPVPYRDAHGRQSYNPAGHVDALRWLVVHGLLAELRDIDVVITSSYSNWSDSLYGDTTLALAGFAARLSNANDDRLFVAEVMERPVSKRTGSFLVECVGQPGNMRLVKYAYGSGSPYLPRDTGILMSTNTLYFRVSALISRLLAACLRDGIPSFRDEFLRWLSETAPLHRHNERATLFDAAFPIGPHLTIKRAPDGIEVIQAERDLDQLSLLGTPSPIQPVYVGEDRNLSVKQAEQLENPTVLRRMFAGSV